MQDHIREEQVINDLRRRNPRALQYLMDLYGKRVYALVYRILNGVASKEDMEECASDVFVKVWENHGKYEAEKGSLKTWIFIQAKYTALDYRRKLSRERSRVTEDWEALPAREAVEDVVLSNEDRRIILETMDTLNETDRKIFYKRYFFYEHIDAIAEQFGLTRSAVENRLWRSRKKIKERLESREEGYDGTFR